MEGNSPTIGRNINYKGHYEKKTIEISQKLQLETEPTYGLVCVQQKWRQNAKEELAFMFVITLFTVEATKMSTE